MSRLRRAEVARLVAALVPVIVALTLAGAGVSSATDPVSGSCAAATDPSALTTAPSDGVDANAGVAGPEGPLSTCAADAPATPDPQPVAAPEPSDDPGPQEPAAEPASPGPAVAEPAADHLDAVSTEPAHGGGLQTARADEPSEAAPSADPEPTAHAPGAPSSASAAPAPDERRQRPRRASHTITVAHRRHAAHHITEQADVYFPPVFVDWAALTPFGAPEFGADEATRFPGPLFLLPIYQAAAAQYDVPWQILASINEIETNFGANTHHSSAGAVGWMQFLPSTWRTYGVDANGDGIENPEDPVDAIFAAARYLHASGSVQDLGRALFSYNHANWYVDRVLQRAVEIGSIPEDLLASLTAAGRKDAGALRRSTGASGYLAAHAEPDTIGRIMLLNDEDLATATLADARVQIYSCGRDDVRAGIVDRRILETIEYLAFAGDAPSVTSLRCGHSLHTATGNISEHAYGAAVDIARVNGIPVLGHQGAGSITDATIQELLKLGGSQRPHQIISLMTFAGAANTLALADHDDHIHIGFAPVRPLAGS